MLLLAWAIASVVAAVSALAVMALVGRTAQLSPYHKRTQGLAVMPLLAAALFVAVAVPAWRAGLLTGGLAGVLPALACVAGGLMLVARQWPFLAQHKPLGWVLFHASFATALPPCLGTAVLGLLLAETGSL